MTFGQKAAAWAVVQALFAGCSAGGAGDPGSPSPSPTPSAPTQSPPPAPAPGPTQAPVITAQPASTSVAVGATATFSVTIDQPTGAVYQWYRNGTMIFDAVGATYTTPVTTAADNGALITVTAFTTGGTVQSSAATLTVTSPAPAPGPTPPAPAPAPTPSPTPPAPAPSPTPAAPSITTQPASAAVFTGSTATFTVAATGTGLTYQWHKNGAAITGATAASYTTPAAAWSDQNTSYTVVVTNSGGGSVTSSVAALTLALSPDQQISESFTLAPSAGVYELDWSLNYVGAQTPTTSLWMVYDYASYSISPLTHGPLRIQQQPEAKIASSLSTPPVSPTRVLKNGVILVVPDRNNWFNVSYVGTSIRVDNLASDASTVAYSQIRSGYSTGSLSGLLHSAPTVITNPFNSIFANANVLDTTTSWATGAAYMVYTATNLGDRYNVFDCTIGVVTTDANVNPCQTGTTLAAAMAAGEQSTSDNVTYTTTDGTMTTVGGVPLWVATNPRRGGPNGTGAYTTEYRVYFQLNGNVYTGALILDGAVEGTHHYRTVPTDSSTTVYLNYEMRLNQPAVQSLIAGSLL